jgi:hypothetical protein
MRLSRVAENPQESKDHFKPRKSVDINNKNATLDSQSK